MSDAIRKLIDCRLESVEHLDYTWFFTFEGGVAIATESPWRLIEGGRIKVTSEDHGHPFGLPQPIDAVERVISSTASRPVVSASIDTVTGDLLVTLGDGVQLQFLQMSCGYESWRLTAPGNQTICLGGGDVADFSES